MDENNTLRQRDCKKKLRVTMPNGKVICHKSATLTLIDVLIEIGSENFGRIKTENCHLPLLSKEIYPKYKEWMKPVIDGWYINAQSDTGQKYMQLMSIKSQLGLNMEIEVGTEFITSDKRVEQKSKKRDNKLLVKFPDGEFIGETNPIDTFINTIWKIGIDEIYKKEIKISGKNLITTSKTYNGQVQVNTNRWLTVPNTTKDKYKSLRIIGAYMHINLEVTII